MTAAAYRAATSGNPQFVQVPTAQHQQQYVTYSQIHHPSQFMAPNSAAPANYAYEFADPAHAQIYYSQPMAPTMPSQYQTMAAATLMQPEISAQHPSDGMKQQIRTYTNNIHTPLKTHSCYALLFGCQKELEKGTEKWLCLILHIAVLSFWLSCCKPMAGTKTKTNTQQ